MAGYLLNMSAVVICPHGGTGKFPAPNPRVMVGGQPVPIIAAPILVAGCAFPPPPAANGPCVTAQWIPPTGTTRVKSMGMPLVCESTQTSPTVTSGTPMSISSAGQFRVKGI